MEPQPHWPAASGCSGRQADDPAVRRGGNAPSDDDADSDEYVREESPQAADHATAIYRPNAAPSIGVAVCEPVTKRAKTGAAPAETTSKILHRIRSKVTLGSDSASASRSDLDVDTLSQKSVSVGEQSAVTTASTLMGLNYKERSRVLAKMSPVEKTQYWFERIDLNDTMSKGSPDGRVCAHIDDHLKQYQAITDDALATELVELRKKRVLLGHAINVSPLNFCTLDAATRTESIMALQEASELFPFACQEGLVETTVNQLIKNGKESKALEPGDVAAFLGLVLPFRRLHSSAAEPHHQSWEFDPMNPCVAGMTCADGVKTNRCFNFFINRALGHLIRQGDKLLMQTLHVVQELDKLIGQASIDADLSDETASFVSELVQGLRVVELLIDGSKLFCDDDGKHTAAWAAFISSSAGAHAGSKAPVAAKETETPENGLALKRLFTMLSTTHPYSAALRNFQEHGPEIEKHAGAVAKLRADLEDTELGTNEATGLIEDALKNLVEWQVELVPECLPAIESCIIKAVTDHVNATPAEDPASAGDKLSLLKTAERSFVEETSFAKLRAVLETQVSQSKSAAVALGVANVLSAFDAAMKSVGDAAALPAVSHDALRKAARKAEGINMTGNKKQIARVEAAIREKAFASVRGDAEVRKQWLASWESMLTLLDQVDGDADSFRLAHRCVSALANGADELTRVQGFGADSDCQPYKDAIQRLNNSLLYIKKEFGPGKFAPTGDCFLFFSG